MNLFVSIYVFFFDNILCFCPIVFRCRRAISETRRYSNRKYGNVSRWFSDPWLLSGLVLFSFSFLNLPFSYVAIATTPAYWFCFIQWQRMVPVNRVYEACFLYIYCCALLFPRWFLHFCMWIFFFFFFFCLVVTSRWNFTIDGICIYGTLYTSNT